MMLHENCEGNIMETVINRQGSLAKETKKFQQLASVWLAP